jgi:hypothetical protein
MPIWVLEILKAVILPFLAREFVQLIKEQAPNVMVKVPAYGKSLIAGVAGAIAGAANAANTGVTSVEGVAAQVVGGAMIGGFGGKIVQDYREKKQEVYVEKKIEDKSGEYSPNTDSMM